MTYPILALRSVVQTGVMVFPRTVYLRALNFAYFLDSLPLTSTSENFVLVIYSTGYIYIYANARAVTSPNFTVLGIRSSTALR